MKTDQLLDFALKTQGRYSRPNKFATWYANIVKDKAYATAAWCDVWVSWIADQVGATKDVGRFAYCPSHANWFKKNKRWGTTPKRGAVVFFDWNGDKVADHVGYVVDVLPDGRIKAIEGNTTKGGVKNSVALQTRSKADIFGYGYPAYLDSPAKSYTVVKGDTLSGIAKKYSMTWQKLYELNKGTIGADPKLIKPGQKLRLP
ncbi:LysM peptidoglycan-binding domain-containing protein [Herbidospora cretacea]|uniref:LysM peptidoglycan-binding domain-containing protein n=1 Tax=Herbidospora cretacea TaxID=28444 RepID=UPI000772FF2F|nr:LysM peptidoglycan-binding domain-containing protein [Herbidospora cretacea]